MFSQSDNIDFEYLNVIVEFDKLTVNADILNVVILSLFW